MTLRHMKIFLEVYKTENTTKAAENLHMTQPAVSRAIKEIEGYYGVRLFDRINKKLYITETGKIFYTYALHILDSFDQMEKGLRNWEEIGVLRVGATVTIGNSLLPKAILEFKKQYPKLTIKATIAKGFNLQSALLNNQLDFAVIEGSVNNEELLMKQIAKDRLVLILPPSDARGGGNIACLEALADDAFILRDEGSVSRRFVDNVFSAHGITLTACIESVSTQAIVRAVHEGLGISLLPERLVKPAIESGYVATAAISGEDFIRKNYIVWHRQKFLTQSAKAFMDCFCDLSYYDR